jgi:hypothetical protein
MDKIFQEPPDDVDETWTHGAMLGGMAGYTELELANSYFLAANELVEVILSRRFDGCDLINPIMYSYRHSIELYLKCATQPRRRNHDLGSLLAEFCQHVVQRYGQPVPEWFTTPIAELAKYDERSDVFRYEESLSGTCRVIVRDGEFWVDLPWVKERLQHIRTGFMKVILADREGGQVRETFTVPPPVRWPY